MSTGLSSDSRLMNNDETLWIVRVNQEVGVGITYVDGKPVRDAGKIEMFRCVCNLQPVDGQDLLRYAEGDQSDDQFWVWSNDRDRPLTAGDLTSRGGTRYECQQTEPWGNYTRARFVATQTLTSLDAP